MTEFPTSEVGATSEYGIRFANTWTTFGSAIAFRQAFIGLKIFVLRKDERHVSAFSRKLS